MKSRDHLKRLLAIRPSIDVVSPSGKVLGLVTDDLPVPIVVPVPRPEGPPERFVAVDRGKSRFPSFVAQTEDAADLEAIPTFRRKTK